MKTCLKTLNILGATDIIQNVTFMGAAIDKPDKTKSRFKIAEVFSQVVAGEIKNVFTNKDWILLFYNVCETDLAMGRTDVYDGQFLDGKRTNLLGDTERHSKLNAIAYPAEKVFKLQNYDIQKLRSTHFFNGIGHIRNGYRENLQLILNHIDFKH